MWPEFLSLVRPKEGEDLSAMRYTGLSRRYLYNLVGARVIPSYKVGARTLLKKSDMDEYMAKNKREAI